MKLAHIALSVSDSREITDFYMNILGFTQIKTFTLSPTLAEKLFNLSLETSVVHLQKEDLILEIFIDPESLWQRFNHICLYISDRETLMINAKNYHYPTTRVQREGYDLLFISDHSGNRFELKAC